MTDDKQPWPKPQDIVVMTTKERGEMMKLINSLAHGIGLRTKLEICYKEAWKIRQTEIDNLRKEIIDLEKRIK